MERHKLKS